MSAATSPGTGLAYGLQRVASFYAMKSRQQATAERPPAQRRKGPKPSISDEALLVAIEAFDLEASPWEGEGHRKVWARLRVCRGMFPASGCSGYARGLLSPHRRTPLGGNLQIILHTATGVHGGRSRSWMNRFRNCGSVQDAGLATALYLTPVRRGGWPCADGSAAPSSSSRLRLNARPTASPKFPRSGHPWPHYRGAAECPAGTGSSGVGEVHETNLATNSRALSGLAIRRFEVYSLPIRLTPMTATCRVPPLSRVKLGIGWSRGVARDAEQ